MMRYISCSEDERKAMLESIGLKRIEDLFSCIPEQVRLRRQLDLPQALSESELLKRLRELADRNARWPAYSYFLGAGTYNHFVPSVVDAIARLPEFYTAYTPYQPEVSQGTLQAIFEYQTLVCQLSGMEVANASLYDGSTAMAEAVLMAERITGRKKIITCVNVHPEYRAVLRTYAQNLDLSIIELPYLRDSGKFDLQQASRHLDDTVAALVVQSPNFFGVIEDFAQAAEMAHRAGALAIAVVTEAISLGILKPPGELGADIFAGEGQSLGMPMGFGGPHLGLFASLDKYKRSMPGRIAGLAFDADGKAGYVLTLATREQHIRRERATSNICTNVALCALMATVYLCTLGRQGLRQVASQNAKKAHYAASQIGKLSGYRLRFNSAFFNEFVVESKASPQLINRALSEEGIIGGYSLERDYPELSNCMLFCVTEQNSRSDIEKLILTLNKLA